MVSRTQNHEVCVTQSTGEYCETGEIFSLLHRGAAHPHGRYAGGVSETQFDVAVINERLRDFVSQTRSVGAYESAEADRFLDAGESAIAGGKRLRARFVHAAWLAVTDAPTPPPQAVLDACAAVEVFQAAALVHDDLIDNSDTRRGAPAAHRALEHTHRKNNWLGDAEAFGRSAAILLGDLLIAWSDDLFEQGLATCDDAVARRNARALYARMRRDVTVGQFMDLSAEVAWAKYPESEHAVRALKIAEMKSARYSIADPLALGAALGGANENQRASLEAFGLPLGIAFQLRDDMLGVFGDESETGKPSGDDVREGKRTALIAWAREELSPTGRDELDALLGNRELTATELHRARWLINNTSAPARAEALIAENLAAAHDALARAEISDASRTVLEALADASVKRIA